MSAMAFEVIPLVRIGEPEISTILEGPSINTTSPFDRVVAAEVPIVTPDWFPVTRKLYGVESTELQYLLME